MSFGTVAGTVTAGLATDAPSTRRWGLRRADGRLRTVELTVTRRLQGDRHVGWTIIGSDVTTEEESRRELAAAELRWRTMVENLPGIWVSLIDERMLRESTALDLLRDCGNAGELHRIQVGIADLTALGAVFRSALTRTAAECEVTCERNGGVVHVRAVPLPCADGELCEVLVTVRDVTAERTRERAIRTAWDFAQRIFDEAPHGQLILDRSGRVTRANPALSTLTGADSVALTGPRLADGPLAGLLTDQEIESVLAGTTTQLRAAKVLHPEPGHAVHVEIAGVGITGAQADERLLLVNVVDVSERKRFEQQLQHLAHHDALTGLANRRQFDNELGAHLERCRRYGAQGAVVMIDLDHFKEVNDALGHGAGDQLIVSIAAVLRRRLRTSDVVARLGGDEFAILLPVSDHRATCTVAAELVTLIGNTVSVLDGNRPRSVTASIGAVVIRDGHFDASELMATADMTMYDSKDAGRNRFTVHDPDDHVTLRTSTRIAWATRIENALTEDRFVVHAQPILDLRTGRIRNAEILIRMTDEDGGLIMPGQFLHIAERTELITRIDRYMIEQAARVLATMNAVDPEFSVSVNLSGRSVGSADITELISVLGERYRIDLANLVLEITETVAVSDIDTARTFAQHLRDLGCRFALDDFGAGFGSFYYLKHLVFDVVKIDGEFIANICDNASDQLIVASIVQIAHGMGKRVVAEFVKDGDVLDAVTAMGVDKAQGFHVGRPMPVAELLDLVRDPVA